MKAIGWATAITGAALVIAGGLARRSGPAPESAPRSASRPAEEPAPVAEAEPPVRSSIAADAVSFVTPREVERDHSEFWSEVGILMETKTGPGGAELRRDVVERTLRYLGWTDSKGLAFASASEVAVQEVEAAWSVREAQVPDADGHAPYEERKKAALARLEAMLEPTLEREGRLRERMEEWFDAIR